MKRNCATFAKMERICSTPLRPAEYAANSPVLVWATHQQPKIGCLDSRAHPVKTFVPFISASGKLWMLLLICEEKHGGATENNVYLPASFEEGPEAPFLILLASTANGYMTKKLWRSACEKFSELLYPQKESVLVLDNLAAHTNPVTVEYLATANLRCFFIPEHTSHWLQPLDNGINGSIATSVRRPDAFRDSTISGESVVGIEPTLIVNAALKVCSEVVISASWERTGMFPFDKEKVRRLAAPYLSGDSKSAPVPYHETVTDLSARIMKEALDKAGTTKTFAAKNLDFCFACGALANASLMHFFCQVADHGGICGSCWSMMTDADKEDGKCGQCETD